MVASPDLEWPTSRQTSAVLHLLSPYTFLIPLTLFPVLLFGHCPNASLVLRVWTIKACEEKFLNNNRSPSQCGVQ